MKQIWAEDRAEFHGKHVDFDPIFSWPKPVSRPHPQITIGGMGPTVLDRVLSHGDGWFPGHTDEDFPSFGDRIAELRERAARLGRSVEVTLNFGRFDYVDKYAELDVDRVVYLIPANATSSETRGFVANVAKIAEDMKVAGTASPRA